MRIDKQNKNIGIEMSKCRHVDPRVGGVNPGKPSARSRPRHTHNAPGIVKAGAHESNVTEVMVQLVERISDWWGSLGRTDHSAGRIVSNR